MKRCFLILVALLLAGLASVPALAHDSKLYLGVNLQTNIPTGDFANNDWSQEQGGAKTGIGGEFDIGLIGKRGSVYIGYRLGKHDAEAIAFRGGYGDVNASGEWTISRWVIGARWYLFGTLDSPFVPTIGGGLTYGKSTVSATASANSLSDSGEDDSNYGIGTFIEGGAIIRLKKNLSLLADLQYHTFDADFNDTGFGWSRTAKISFFTLQIGARLALI